MAHEKLAVEKWIWTGEDYERMGWHDVRIHAMSTHEILIDNLHVGLGELLLDINYIFKWVETPTPEKYYEFWISPATLAFQNVSGLKVTADSSGGNDPTWDIFDIHRNVDSHVVLGKRAWSWDIELHGGTIDSLATSYEQYIRQEPIRVEDQHLSFKERGGASFARLVPEGK